MAFDRNPKFGSDQSFSEGALRVTDLLWETTGGDVASFPRTYLENLRHDFENGNVSMLELIDRVDLGPDATYEDYCEVVEGLLEVDPSFWPDPEDVVEIPQGSLLHEIESDYAEFDFAEEISEEEAVVKGPRGEVAEEGIREVKTPGLGDLSEKMELFFRKVISSVYLDGVTAVTDAQGNPPNAANNYLMSPDGKSFSGIFYDNSSNQKGKKYAFTLTEGQDGNWSIKY